MTTYTVPQTRFPTNFPAYSSVVPDSREFVEKVEAQVTIALWSLSSSNRVIFAALGPPSSWVTGDDLVDEAYSNDIRTLVSARWAEDWDSPEDREYDNL